MDKLLTIDEVSERLQIPKGSLYNMIHEGRMPFVKIGSRLRFRESSLNKWIEDMESAAREPLEIEL